MTDNAPIQGLRVALKFADSQNTVEILNNLNLNINDLDKIRNISDEGVEQADIQSLSGLTIDLEKEAIAIYNETRSYQNVLSTLNDGRRRIGGNLNISGSIIAPTFKFRTVDFNDNNQIRTVDFSTSRASAWSAFGDASESVFYGGDVILSGANSTIELSTLEFSSQPKQKRFESQIPTHKFRVKIDGEDHDLYAMKGIPLQFKGFFRSVRNMRIDFNILNNLRPSWIIRNTNNQEFVYENRISGTGSNRQSIISFFDSRAEEREIEFYYPVDRITRIDLNNANIFDVPEVSLPALSTLNIINGDLIEMPNIATLYPNISSLDLSRNDLTRSNNISLRTFSPAVIQRLKTTGNTLRTLVLNGVYSNECTANLDELTGLVTFVADSNATNSRRMVGTSPAIGASLQTYNISGNNFTTLAPSVAQSTSLRSLSIRNNSIGGIIDTSGTNLENIETFITGGNSHQIVDMSGKSNLINYQTQDQSFSGGVTERTGTNIFVGCTALETVRVHNTNVLGALPNFTTNPALSFFASWSTGWSDATAEHSIGENTFGPTQGGCRETLDYFNLQSGNLRGPIHPLAFRNMPALRTLVVRSYDRGITGPYPESINDCFSMVNLRLDRNQMSGTIPNFAGNKRLITLVLSQNNFSGTVPSINLPNLRTFFLQNNNIEQLQGLNCPRLTQLNVSFNNLTLFPSLQEAFRLQTLLLNNNSGMRYRNGELEFLTSMRRIEMSNCGFNRGTVDRILIDLNENYDRNPRSNVSVNLLGNSSPSATEEITTIINRLRRQGWTLGLEQ
jgi:Leucine-rich repeat (LRR) protein